MSLVSQVKSVWLIAKASRLQGKGKYDKVIELCLQALHLVPNIRAALILLGCDYIRLHRKEEAIALMQDALKHYPGNPEFQRLLMEAQAL